MTATASLPPQPNRHLDSSDRAWLEQAAKEARREWERARKRGGHAEKAQALACLSGILCDLEGPEVSLRLSRRAHRLWEVVGDPQVIAVSAAVLAVRLLDAGRTQEALHQSATALAGMRQLEPEHRHKGVSHHLGQEFLAAGFPAEAQAWLELALENPACDERGDLLAHLSRALDLQGRLDDAKERLNESCAAYDNQWDLPALAKALLCLARLELRTGRCWEAAGLCQEALRFLTGRSHAASESAQARELLALCLAAGGYRQPDAGPRKRSMALCWLESH